MRDARERLKGSMPALITPFRDGKVDEAAFRKFVAWQIDQGSHGLVPTGTTGESATLSHEEHMRVVEICVDEAKGRVPVIAGAGSNSTAEAISLTRHAKAGRRRCRALRRALLQQADAGGDLPAFRGHRGSCGYPHRALQHPGRSVVEISVETMARLARIANIVGVKDATANLARPSRERPALRQGFPLSLGRGHYILWATWPMAVMAASPSPRMWRRSCAPSSRMRACRAPSSMRWRCRTSSRRCTTRCSARRAPRRRNSVSLLGLATDEVRLPIVAASETARARVREAMATPAC
jgi:4-hydroxy-tetrahydrodipicolinate synthase